MQPEENPLIQKALNENINILDEIEKIDNELNECRLKLLSSNVKGDALEVVKRRIDELLDKRLVWMNDGIKIEKSGKTIKTTKPLKNKKRILRLMRRRLK